jgi:hypothetical protein
MKGLGFAVIPLTLLLCDTGCGRLKQQVKDSMDSNPQMRQGAVDSARKSCVQTAMAKLPKVPGMETKVQNYCDCFATKGLGKFSNSELASIGFHGGHFTPEQQGKLNDAVQMCSGALLEHGPRSHEQ